MFPKVSDILFIQIASNDEQEANRVFKSRVAEMDEEKLYIEYPMDEKTGKLKRLSFGDELAVTFFTDQGIKNYFATYVNGFRDENVRMVAIKRPAQESISSIQRRSFLRVAADLEIAIKLNSNIRFLAITEDVSGGGLSFRCDGKWTMKQGSKLNCWLLLPYRNGAVEHAPLTAEIVRVVPLETGKQRVMVKFMQISDSDQQRIIRYCFEKQFEVRKQ